jgi:hypothetical protein
MIGLAMMLAAGRVILTLEGPPCVTKVDGVVVASADITKAMTKLKARRRGVLIKIGDAPYKCVGGVIYQVQRSKVKRVSFGPPPAREGV